MRVLARLMIGGELAECHSTPQKAKEVLLDVQHLSLQSPDPFGTSLKDISLQVRSGEILWDRRCFRKRSKGVDDGAVG